MVGEVPSALGTFIYFIFTSYLIDKDYLQNLNFILEDILIIAWWWYTTASLCLDRRHHSLA